MRSWLLGLALGVAVLQTRPTLFNLLTAAALLLVALALSVLIAIRRSRRSNTRNTFIEPVLEVIARLILGALAGFAWATLMAHAYLRYELPRALEGEDVVLIGTVASLPGLSLQGTRFDFAIEQASGLDRRVVTVPPRVSLLWPAGMAGRAAAPVPDIQPGERWQLLTRLSRPHGNANPDGFDYEVWLLEQNLRATGSVRSTATAAAINQRLARFVFTPDNLVEASRSWLRARILAALPGKRFASVLVALVVGDQRGVQQADWTIFTRTGIGHLISISGLHVTMIAGLFALGGGALWRRSFFTDAQLPLRLPVQKFSALVGFGTALIYVLLAGFGVPAQRTLYMIGVVALALWSHRLTSVSHVLCAALGVVVVLDPWAVMSPGFWLSFGAVATILYASVARTPAPAQEGRWRRLVASLKPEVHTQYVVTVGLIPLTMLLFGQVSQISPLANAFAIPLISFVVTPLALLGAVAPAPLARWLLLGAHACVEGLAAVLTWLAALPSAVWSAPTPPGWMFGAAALGTVWLLAPRGWPLRWAGLAGWLPMLCNAPSHPTDGNFDVLAFDIGQGMALLVETSHHRLLYDTGPAYSVDSDGANRTIVPYLKARGINRLDAVVVSHSDTDHSGGALSLLAAIPTALVTTSLPLDGPIVAAARAHRRCVAGQHWEWDGVRFEMLYPAASVYESSKWKPNAHSCTLRISHGTESMLLPGDIEAIQEIELLGRSPGSLPSTVLLAPHHGSGTSSTVEFLQQVGPRLAIFQVGYRNRYHHPKTEVFNRYGEQGIERLRTDQSGAISLHFGPHLTWTAYRETHLRYWYDR